RHQVRVGLEAKADAAGASLVCEGARVGPEGPDLIGGLGVARERVEDEDAELGARREHALQAAEALAGVELRMAAHRHAAQAVALEQAAGFLDLGGPEAARCGVHANRLATPDLA